MSPSKYTGKKFQLRQAAIDDLKEIGLYTLDNYGKDQRDKYLKGLAERFQVLADNPRYGRSRDDVKTGYYSSVYRKHVIFYIDTTSHLEVISILHQSMVPEPGLWD